MIDSIFQAFLLTFFESIICDKKVIYLFRKGDVRAKI